MSQFQENMDKSGPTTAIRLRGIGIVFTIYVLQLIALNAIRIPLQQSVILPIVALAILATGWLGSGLTLGATVINRSLGWMRFIIGLGIALLLSFLLVIGVIEYLNNLPPTYNGP